MNTTRWIEDRLPIWQQVEQQLATIEHGASAERERVRSLVRAYPELARDLAIARREAPGGPLARRLDALYRGVHAAIHRSPTRFSHELMRIVTHDAAEVAKSLRRHIVWVTALFATAMFAGAWMVNRFPSLVGLFLSPEMIEGVQAGELWTDGLLNVTPSSLLAAQIFTNNVAVMLTCVAFGVLFGLGTLYIIGLNGIMLGAAFAYTAQYGLAPRLFEFVVAHGCVELTLIMIAGAAGAALGEALVRPGNRRRSEAFQTATMQVSRLLVVCIPFMIGAGLIEGYVSPNEAYPFVFRLGIGLGYFALLVAVLSGAFSRRRRQALQRPGA